MKDLLFFLVFFLMLILQRVFELVIARNNEKWMKAQGAIEFGRRHYYYMVAMHFLFFLSFFTETIIFNRGHSKIWPIFISIFLLTQCIRIWVISSLGKYWNTKIVVLPNAKIIRSGPYRYIRHPNYFVVSVEFAVIPLLFSDYFTASLFTLLNVIMLSIRIPEEEKALKQLTEYEDSFQGRNRFLPKLLN